MDLSTGWPRINITYITAPKNVNNRLKSLTQYRNKCCLQFFFYNIFIKIEFSGRRVAIFVGNIVGGLGGLYGLSNCLGEGGERQGRIKLSS